MAGYSNGNSFAANSPDIRDGGETRNTEPWIWRLQSPVHPGALR